MPRWYELKVNILPPAAFTAASKSLQDRDTSYTNFDCGSYMSKHHFPAKLKATLALPASPKDVLEKTRHGE